MFNQSVKLIVGILLTTLSVVAANERPNIVFIMADDLGLGDVSYHRTKFWNKKVVVETPAIDSLAQEGMWFTDAHSSTSLCSPTRYCVMSGNMNFRGYAHWGVWGTFRKNAIDEGQATLGTVAQDAGYKTGFIGKWHLGGDFTNKDTGELFRGDDHGKLNADVDMSKMVGGGPQQLGFDYSFTLPCGVQGPVYTAYENGDWYPLGKDSKVIFLDKDTAKDPFIVSDKGPGLGDSEWDTAGMGQLLSAKAADFINKQAGKEPFFLCYWSPTVHIPHMPPDEFDGIKVKGSTPTAHMDMIRDLDLQVARIIKALKDKGVYENTLIVFTSDNGGLSNGASINAGHDPNGGWRGHKNDAWEGGHRVPFIAVWNGKIKAGSVSDEAVVNHDMLATMADVLKISVPKDDAVDSLSLIPILTDKKYEPRKYLTLQSGSKTEVMMRDGDWKIVIDSDYQSSFFKPTELYNLKEDSKETKNLIDDSKQKERIEAMLKLYLDIRNNSKRTTPVISYGK